MVEHMLTCTDTRAAMTVVTLGVLFTPEQARKLAQDHDVDEKVVELIAEMLRIVECRRSGLNP